MLSFVCTLAVGYHYKCCDTFWNGFDIIKNILSDKFIAHPSVVADKQKIVKKIRDFKINLLILNDF